MGSQKIDLTQCLRPSLDLITRITNNRSFCSVINQTTSNQPCRFPLNLYFRGYFMKDIVVGLTRRVYKQSISAKGDAVGRGVDRSCRRQRAFLLAQVFQPFLVVEQLFLEALQTGEQILPVWEGEYFLLELARKEPFLSNWFFSMTALKSLQRNLLSLSGSLLLEGREGWVGLGLGLPLLERRRQNSIWEQSMGSLLMILLRWFHSRMTSSFWATWGATDLSKKVRKAYTSFLSLIINYQLQQASTLSPRRMSLLTSLMLFLGSEYHYILHGVTKFNEETSRELVKCCTLIRIMHRSPVLIRKTHQLWRIYYQFAPLAQMHEQPQSSAIFDQQLPTLQDNAIRMTRRIIEGMNERQKFQKARAHVLDSLAYKHPRPESESLSTPRLFRVLYGLHTSGVWEWGLFLLGYVFMYLVILDSESYAVKIALQGAVLLLFWVDTAIIFYCKSYDEVKRHRTYSPFFIFSVVVMVAMTVDLVVFVVVGGQGGRPIRPFRILRAFVPLIYDAELRKSLLALASAYKDILVFFLFFAFVVTSWALLGSRALTFDPSYRDPDFPLSMDPYKNNYSDLGYMIFIVYVTATYDSYPDNQTLAIQNYQPNYIFFLAFVFTNMFLFSLIPGFLIYYKFRETRSKILLVDEIRQKHSLVLAFVTLAENESNLSIEKLIKFLLFLYRYKIRYVEFITDICLRLDDNNNKSIQVNEFMQLSQILLENSALLPPRFEDVEQWVAIRRWCNANLNLKNIVKHWVFQLIVSIIIVLSFINAIFLMFFNSSLASTFDTVFVWLFLAELLIRILAIGPENFFNDRWNNVDTLLVMFGIAFFFLPDSTGADSVVRMSRIFRIATLARLISHSNFWKDVDLQILKKLRNIFSILLEIFAIILKFFPLFMFFFYIFAIIGMEAFYNSYSSNGSPAYNNYQQFQSFRSFVQAQYVMVMILTEAGWSQIAYDHSWRNPNYFGIVMTFFCAQHLIIVYIIAIIIRGVFWQVFFTVDAIFSQRERECLQEEEKEQQIASKTMELKEINEMIDNNEFIEPNTVIRRELIENKLDKEIFMKLKHMYERQNHQRSSKRLRSNRSLLVERIMDDWSVNINNFEAKKEGENRSVRSQSSMTDRKSKLSINEISDVHRQDFQSEIEELLTKLILNPRIKCNEIIAYPKIFVEYLNRKFRVPEEMVSNGQDFDLRYNPLYNQQSMYFHIYEIHALLGIETSKREQKAMIIQRLLEEDIINEDTAEKLIRKKLQEKIFHIDTKGTLRRLFLQETNEELIKKFEVEYFSDLYGYSFRHINKMTLEPLMRLEATLTYSLRNILRYPQIENTEFFEMFTRIEDQLSNKLLKRGSLFKFVYKIDHESDIWFSIQYKQQQEMRIHFVKTGIWAYTKEMADGQVYYAADAFNWKLSDTPDRKACQQYMKRFYQSFEGLAFSLLDENEFFSANPTSHIYDLYVQTFDVQQVNRFVSRRLEVSKIMAVVLSKEEERADVGASELMYPISDIVGGLPQRQKHKDFSFDQTDNETYEKLKNIAAMDVERIVQSEGLPFSYIVNLLREVSDIVHVCSKNFLYQIEKVLNDQYEIVNEQVDLRENP